MSHFSVLVIGADIDAQLQPFHEFECTGINDQYVVDQDVTEECKEQSDLDDPLGLGWFGLEDRVIEDETQADRADKHMYGFAIVKDGALVKAIRRTNPNKHWDWHQLGGRWSGFLRLKDGASGELGRPGLMGSCANEGPGRADQAKKGDVDFEGMRAEKGSAAGALWDKAQALTGGRGWDSWDHVRTVVCAGDIEAARRQYHEQPAVKAMKEGDREEFGWELDDALAGSREAFVQAARDRACTTWALVHKGEWSEKGRMGWFGTSTGDMDQSQWNRLLSEFLDVLPDDTLLSVVDCHI